MLIPVLIAIAVIAIGAFLFLRWFERYRYTEAWRHSELRDWSFGFLMWFGGLFGHRLPPPPQTKIEFASKDRVPASDAGDGQPGGAPSSGGAAFPEETPKEEN